MMLVAGCATKGSACVTPARAFALAADTFAFPNELVWEYEHDTAGKWVSHRRQPPANYSHHCFVLARSARQFFEHAQFAPNLAKTNSSAYRHLIRKIASCPPHCAKSGERKIIIPGYANLRDFSADWESVLKQSLGSASRSYVQRGHWRMMLPFSRAHQERIARQLMQELAQSHPPVVHLVVFPKLSINHAVLLFAAQDRGHEIEFSVYDPNRPEKPARIVFDRDDKAFHFAANDYFAGGKINVYEIYHTWNY